MSTPVTPEGAPKATAEIRDAARMRALASPVRLAIIEYLRPGLAATATECAQVCGLSPSAMSYHLRALADVGLIREAPGRGDGRERLWEGVFGGLEITGGEATDEADRAAETELFAAVITRQEIAMRRFMERIWDLPAEWGKAGVVDTTLVMTAAELDRVLAGVSDLIQPYLRKNRPEEPEGARRVSFVVRSIPEFTEDDLPKP